METALFFLLCCVLVVGCGIGALIVYLGLFWGVSEGGRQWGCLH